MSAATRSKFSTKKKANIATISFPITADGTKSLSLANLARFAFMARPSADTKPNKSPTIFPICIES